MSERERMERALGAWYTNNEMPGNEFGGGYLAGLRRAEERMMDWWGDDAENEVPMSEKDVFMRVRGLLKEIIKELG